MSPPKSSDINGPRPSPLRIHKDSRLIRKPSQLRQPLIIYTHSPKIIHTQPKDFMALVQRLTGFTPHHHQPLHNSNPLFFPPSSDNDNDSSSVLTTDDDNDNHHPPPPAPAPPPPTPPFSSPPFLNSLSPSFMDFLKALPEF